MAVLTRYDDQADRRRPPGRAELGRPGGVRCGGPTPTNCAEPL